MGLAFVRKDKFGESPYTAAIRSSGDGLDWMKSSIKFRFLLTYFRPTTQKCKLIRRKKFFNRKKFRANSFINSRQIFRLGHGGAKVNNIDFFSYY